MSNAKDGAGNPCMLSMEVSFGSGLFLHVCLPIISEQRRLWLYTKLGCSSPYLDSFAKHVTEFSVEGDIFKAASICPQALCST
jgi:hypothetical protein